jgi:hypothetical protein
MSIVCLTLIFCTNFCYFFLLHNFIHFINFYAFCLFFQLVGAQARYHRKCLQTIEKIIPEMKVQLGQYVEQDLLCRSSTIPRTGYPQQALLCWVLFTLGGIGQPHPALKHTTQHTGSERFTKPRKDCCQALSASSTMQHLGRSLLCSFN